MAKLLICNPFPRNPAFIVNKTGTNEEVRYGDIVDRLADQLALAPEDRGELLPSGKQTVLNNRVHWAKTYLRKEGLILR